MLDEIMYREGSEVILKLEDSDMSCSKGGGRTDMKYWSIELKEFTRFNLLYFFLLADASRFDFHFFLRCLG